MCRCMRPNRLRTPRCARPGPLLCIQRRRPERCKVICQQPFQFVEWTRSPADGIGGVRPQQGQLGCRLAHQALELLRVVTHFGQRVGQGQQTRQGRVVQQARHQLRQAGQQRRQPVARSANGAPRRSPVVRCTRQFQTGLGHRQQVADKVAAVDRGNVHRQQRCAALGVVPIHEVAAVALHAAQGGQRGLQPRQHVLRADPAELARAGHAQQVQADVGGRSAVRHHVVRRDLQIVRRQVVVRRADAALEQTPGVARNGREVDLVLDRQGFVFARRARPADPPGPQRGRGPYQAQGQAQQRIGRVGEQQRTEQHQRHHRNGPVLARHRSELDLGGGLRCGGGGPLQQMASADRHAVERAHHRVHGHQRLLQQLRQQPQPAPQRAGQIGAGLAVKMQLGQVVAAG